jgi:hypothetical protein
MKEAFFFVNQRNADPVVCVIAVMYTIRIYVVLQLIQVS